ncbi:MAG TPA: bifunctional DNA-formamidopyrimidine glycosylase/DNA-(apurinic or apyrimidinic site) lyase [Candidatus Limnocylindria bacterium]|nr:bifunctional DNA-formamidopyrimidine glycosylase/DNA-(apurinic or apyrimidinic site) lyase [Candidatus Limnocylindria bacterium]
MPELPEVETIARELRPLLVGRRFTSAWFDWPNQIKHPAPEEFAGALVGREVLEVERRAKWLVLSLGPPPADPGQGAAVLAIQVKMTGQLDVLPPQTPADQHVHARFGLDDGLELRLRDVRKFARLGVYRRDEAGTILGADDARELFAGHGPEPLDPAFTLRDFKRRLGSRRARLKTLLMDQAFLAGVGNIYADEALWRARVHPLRSAATLNADQQRRLYHSLREVLGEAIERRGSSVDDYRAPGGTGEMQHFLNVYGRTGKPCPRCGRPTRRIVVNARSTHFCSWCQRLPAAQRGSAARELLRAAR